MIWKNRELSSFGDFMTYGIDKCDSKEEAREFIKLYVSENTHARANIGYLAGYYSKEKKHQIFDWFDVVHPIFGTEDLDPSELMRLGMEMGKAAARRERPDNPWHVGALEDLLKKEQK